MNAATVTWFSRSFFRSFNGLRNALAVTMVGALVFAGAVDERKLSDAFRNAALRHFAGEA